MKKIWEKPQVEIIHAEISVEEFNQLLDEMAEIVYCHFCQLSDHQVLVTHEPQKRTGTNG